MFRYYRVIDNENKNIHFLEIKYFSWYIFGIYDVLFYYPTISMRLKTIVRNVPLLLS